MVARRGQVLGIVSERAIETVEEVHSVVAYLVFW